MKDIKDLRKKTGLSQKEFADKYNLSVRTLQQWEQGISRPLDSLLYLISKDVENNSNLRSLYNPKSTNKWKICIDNPFMNCEKIYPIQQKKVAKLLNDLSSNNKVHKIIIFGSSTTDRCHIGSDIDIYIESDSDVQTKDVYDFEYDLWSNHTADDRLKKEIYDKGVIVYEQN